MFTVKLSQEVLRTVPAIDAFELLTQPPCHPSLREKWSAINPFDPGAPTAFLSLRKESAILYGKEPTGSIAL